MKGGGFPVFFCFGVSGAGPLEGTTQGTLAACGTRRCSPPRGGMIRSDLRRAQGQVVHTCKREKEKEMKEREREGKKRKREREREKEIERDRT